MDVYQAVVDLDRLIFVIVEKNYRTSMEDEQQ